VSTTTVFSASSAGALLAFGTVIVATKDAWAAILAADEAEAGACACEFFAVVGLMLFLPVAWRTVGLTGIGIGAEVCIECGDGCIISCGLAKTALRWTLNLQTGKGVKKMGWLLL
jgi:hypothetical protein